MDFWRVDRAKLRWTDAYRVPTLKDYCWRFHYKYPLVGYCRVPKKAWCRCEGKYAAHLTLVSSSNPKHFGIITSFNCFGNTVEEAVNKLVKEAVDFILWRAQELHLYG